LEARILGLLEKTKREWTGEGPAILPEPSIILSGANNDAFAPQYCILAELPKIIGPILLPRMTTVLAVPHNTDKLNNTTSGPIKLLRMPTIVAVPHNTDTSLT
jgi:hypothetical protein